MKHKLLLYFFLAFVLGMAGSIQAMRIAHPAPVPIMRVGGKTIRLLIARTPAQVTKGLSGHDRLPEDMGMLFYFNKPDRYTFWMPDMKFPLDIVWLRGSVVQETVQLDAPVPGLPIPIYTPSSTADRVLELDAGLAARYGLVPGAKVVLPP